MPRRKPDPGGAPPPGTPRLAALRLLGRRDYSAAELLSKLVDRGYPAGAVREAVDRLIADGAIDDRRTAAAHVRTAARIKGRGTHRIRRELEARGLAPSVIREALEQVSADDDLAAIAGFLARRRLSPPFPADRRRRLFQQLLRRGFPAALIGRALAFDPTEE